MGCAHVYIAKGKFYKRQNFLWGGQLFTVFRCRKCTHCNKLERRVVLKKVTASADNFERQLKFSGIKPEDEMN